MPLQDCVQLEQEQVLVELVARSGGQDSERELLAAREPGWAGTLALQQANLVPQHEDLQVLIAVAWSHASDQVDEECHEVHEQEPEHTPLPRLTVSRRHDTPRQGRIIADRAADQAGPNGAR